MRRQTIATPMNDRDHSRSRPQMIAVASGGHADSRKNSSANDRAHAKQGQLEWPKHAAQMVFGTIRLLDEAIE